MPLSRSVFYGVLGQKQAFVHGGRAAGAHLVDGGLEADYLAARRYEQSCVVIEMNDGDAVSRKILLPYKLQRGVLHFNKLAAVHAGRSINDDANRPDAGSPTGRKWLTSDRQQHFTEECPQDAPKRPQERQVQRFGKLPSQTPFHGGGR